MRKKIKGGDADDPLYEEELRVNSGQKAVELGNEAMRYIRSSITAQQEKIEQLKKISDPSRPIDRLIDYGYKPDENELIEPTYFIGTHPRDCKYGRDEYKIWLTKLSKLIDLKLAKKIAYLWISDSHFITIKELDEGRYIDGNNPGKPIRHPKVKLIQYINEYINKETKNIYLANIFKGFLYPFIDQYTPINSPDNIQKLAYDYSIFEIESKISYSKPLYQLILLAPENIEGDNKDFYTEYTENLTIGSDELKKSINEKMKSTVFTDSYVFKNMLEKNGCDLYKELKEAGFKFADNKMYYLQIFIYRVNENDSVKEYIALSINEIDKIKRPPPPAPTQETPPAPTQETPPIEFSIFGDKRKYTINKLNNLDFIKIERYFEIIKEYLFKKDDNNISDEHRYIKKGKLKPIPPKKHNEDHEDHEGHEGHKGGKKTSKKEVLGKMRCIYKIPGDRKEYVKYKGKLITVKDYKMLNKKPGKVTNKKPKTVAKDKKPKRSKKMST
jgi:hypothetical protein